MAKSVCGDMGDEDEESQIVPRDDGKPCQTCGAKKNDRDLVNTDEYRRWSKKLVSLCWWCEFVKARFYGKVNVGAWIKDMNANPK